MGSSQLFRLHNIRYTSRMLLWTRKLGFWFSNASKYKIYTNLLLIDGNVVELHYLCVLLIDATREETFHPYLSYCVTSSHNLSQNSIKSLQLEQPMRNSPSNQCVKSVQIRRSYFWSLFSCIPTEHGDLLCKSPYSVRIQENTGQK